MAQRLVEGDTLEWYDTAVPRAGRRAAGPRTACGFDEGAAPELGLGDAAVTSTFTLRSAAGEPAEGGGVTLRLPETVDRVSVLRLGGLVLGRAPPLMAGRGHIRGMAPVRFSGAQQIALERRAADGTTREAVLHIPPTLLPLTRGGFVVLPNPGSTRWIAPSPHGLGTLDWPAPRLAVATGVAREVLPQAVSELEVSLGVSDTEVALGSGQAVLWSPPLAAPELLAVIQTAWGGAALSAALEADVALRISAAAPGFQAQLRNAAPGDTYTLRTTSELGAALGLPATVAFPAPLARRGGLPTAALHMDPAPWTGAAMGPRDVLAPDDVARSLSWATGFRLDPSRAAEARTVVVTDAAGTRAEAVLPPGIYSPRTAGRVLARVAGAALAEAQAGSPGIVVEWSEAGLARVAPAGGAPPGGALSLDMGAVPELAAALGFEDRVLEGAGAYEATLPRAAGPAPRVQLGVRPAQSRFTLSVLPGGGFELQLSGGGVGTTRWARGMAVPDLVAGDVAWVRAFDTAGDEGTRVFLDEVVSVDAELGLVELRAVRNTEGLGLGMAVTVGRYDGALGARVFPAAGRGGAGGAAVLNGRLGLPDTSALGGRDAVRSGPLPRAWGLAPTGPITLHVATAECSPPKGFAQDDAGDFHESTALLFASPRPGPGVAFEQDVVLQAHTCDPTFSVGAVTLTLRGADGRVLGPAETGGFACTVLLRHTP